MANYIWKITKISTNKITEVKEVFIKVLNVQNWSK
jgi:hypothetical protein